MTNTLDADGNAITLDAATGWARSNREWEKVYLYLFHHPQDLFHVCPNRRWPIAHQIVYHDRTDLLKQVLTLYSDDQIDINTKSGDDRTLLSVATEKRTAHPVMYAYVSRLFAQDELITAAKNKNWQLVRDLLEKNRELANEKPAYSPSFLLHYIVQNGTVQVLQDFITRFQFHPTVVNSENEQPLALASRLGKQDMCSVLRPLLIARSPSSYSQPDTPPVEPSSLPNATTAPVNQRTNPPPIGFGALVQNLDQTGDQTAGQQTLINTAVPPPRPRQPHPNQTSQNQQSQSSAAAANPSTIRHVRVKKTIVSEVPLAELDSPDSPPPPRASTEQKTPSAEAITSVLTGKLLCPLTKQPFIDPVVASDGQTYERSAITKWVNTHHTSPVTGHSMNCTFRDNKEIQALAQLMSNQK